MEKHRCNFYYLPFQKDNTIENMFKIGSNENIMFFFNKPPKWNECKNKLTQILELQAFVLNFNGRVDKASVKNF